MVSKHVLASHKMHTFLMSKIKKEKYKKGLLRTAESIEKGLKDILKL